MGYLDVSLRELHEAYLRKETTPLEVTREALARAKANQDNCFEAMDEEGALAFAESLMEVEADNLLWGVPFLAKDNLSTKGIETCASSNILKGYIPVFDATVIAKLKEKKAVLLGKTTLDELGMGGTGTAGHKGPTFNPYDPSHKRMIGGSSSGSAAATAAGIVPFALGSDTGDSIRKPASFGGLVGLKPTWGRISRFGLFPFAPSMDHVGFFTRYVEDAAILLQALAGRDNQDSTSSFGKVGDYLSEMNLPIQGFKIAVIQEIVDGIRDSFFKDKFMASIEAMRRTGIQVDFIHFPKKLLDSVHATYYVVSSAEATSNNANLDGIKFGPYYEGASYEETMRKARTEGFSEMIKRRFVIGSFALLKENQEELFLMAKKARARIVGEMNRVLKDYDFVFAPAAPSFARGFDEPYEAASAIENHLAIGNFGGYPSLSLPLALENGLPLGINFTGRPFSEGKLFAIAKWFEGYTGLGGLSVLNAKERQ